MRREARGQPFRARDDGVRREQETPSLVAPHSFSPPIHSSSIPPPLFPLSQLPPCFSPRPLSRLCLSRLVSSFFPYSLSSTTLGVIFYCLEKNDEQPCGDDSSSDKPFCPRVDCAPSSCCRCDDRGERCRRCCCRTSSCRHHWCGCCGRRAARVDVGRWQQDRQCQRDVQRSRPRERHNSAGRARGPHVHDGQRPRPHTPVWRLRRNLFRYKCSLHCAIA